jgi:hypothetical protein
MKTQKLIGFDMDVMKKLIKIKNASKLINETMRDYFFVGNNQKKEKIKANIVKLHRESFEKSEEALKSEDSLKKILEKENKLKEIFKDIPKQILNDFKEFPNMTEAALGSRFKDIYCKKFNIKYTRILEAFRHQSK